MPFVGREREMATLERLYATDKFQMPVIYGRRRVGKTSLIAHFVEGKPAIFFSARESTERENLIALSEAIARFESGGALRESDRPAPVFESFDRAFAYIFELARKQRLIFVIDEYPYLAQSYRAASSLLQHCIDGEHEESRLFLILCGSSMSFMEHQVMGYKSPLYGRRTAQIKVMPFDIVQASRLLEGVGLEEIVSWYGIAGGIPLYLEQFDRSLSLQENLAHNVLRPDSFLYGEPDSFLQQEVREPARYNAIIRAIASGEGRLSDISSVAGIDKATITAYLKGLMELGVVCQEQPVVDANRKKMRYVLSDNLFRFWYRFVPRYLTPLQAGRSEEVARLIADDHLSTYLGPVFEDVCRQWLVSSMGEAGIPLINDIGRWWGTDNERKERAELDIVALCDDGSMICGECKWQNKLSDVDVLRTLEHRAGLIADGREVRLFLFSKSGFTDQCREAAAQSGCTLIALSDMGLSS
ncbi:ATP-binding protein [Adlercreutzia sp. R7]|uniref:ATP-binding protein n=1 Tax=Adlercreutzia wanghongyangiae TaxID=3111451 RepID=A0ABU6IKU7_9ACTN|nr:ATP-binding protein [Adlercreutzia sp. R7]